MKKILYILLIIPFTFFGQGFLAIEQDSPLDLAQGWNMFGFNCFEPMNVSEAFISIEDKVVIVKDNNGAVYMPEFSFNGIGSLRRNLGYQIKLTEIITDFQFCPFIVPLVEGCMDETAFNYDSSANMDDGSCFCSDDTVAINEIWYGLFDGNIIEESSGINGINLYENNCLNIVNVFGIETSNPNSILDGVCCETFTIIENSGGSFSVGCSDSLALNYNPSANFDEGSCVYNELDVVEGCMDSLACNYNSQANMADGSCTYAEQGYDCEGNIVPQYQVGDLAEGGIVFYVDSTGQHGLVAAMDDLEGNYEWGCWGPSISGADGTATGTGYQNTLDIVAGCSETPIAASEALAYESEGYSDWYLPSRDELLEMYNTIGNGGPEGNIGGFSNDLYWSSSEYNNNYAWSVFFNNGDAINEYNKLNTFRVRVIRSF